MTTRCCDIARTFPASPPGCFGRNTEVYHGRQDLKPALVCEKHLHLFEATPRQAFLGQALRLGEVQDPDYPLWHVVRYGNPGNGPFDTEPAVYRPAAEQQAESKRRAGWSSAEVVTVPVPPHAYRAGILSSTSQKCALCELLESHDLHSLT